MKWILLVWLLVVGSALGQGGSWMVPPGDGAAVLRSGTYVSWEYAGGTIDTNDVVVAESPLLQDGLASVAWDADVALKVEVSADGASWTNFAQTGDAVYARLVVTVPPVGSAGFVSNVVGRSYARADLFGAVSDLGGQVVLVDDPGQARGVVNLRSMTAAVDAVTPAAWWEYRAQGTVRMDGNKLSMGQGWTLVDADGMGVISFADVGASTNGLMIANQDGKVLTATAAWVGLGIETFALDGLQATVGVATNGVVSMPLVQWTGDLLWPDWVTVDAISQSWPETTNGVFEVVADLPASNGFVRAVQDTGERTVRMHGIVTADGYALVDNRFSISDPPVEIGTNSTYTINSSDGPWQNFTFGSATNAVTITMEGPGAGYGANLTTYCKSGFDQRDVTFTNASGGLKFANDAVPTTSEAQIFWTWTGTNVFAMDVTVTQ